MRDVSLLAAIYLAFGLIALMGRFVVFTDRPDLWSLVWVPLLAAAVIVTPFALWGS